jgi:hypothetical protein
MVLAERKFRKRTRTPPREPNWEIELQPTRYMLRPAAARENNESVLSERYLAENRIYGSAE